MVRCDQRQVRETIGLVEPELLSGSEPLPAPEIAELRIGTENVHAGFRQASGTPEVVEYSKCSGVSGRISA